MTTQTAPDSVPEATIDLAAGAAPRHSRAPRDERLGVVRALGGVVSGAALAAAVLLALALVVVPLLLGATPYTILTGSMQPTMPPGTLVVTRPTPVDRIDIGDVVTYQLHSEQPEVVTHRVVGVGTQSDGSHVFLTRGDANNADDDPVLAVQVRGVVAYHVPYLGYVNTWVGANRPGWALKAVAGGLIAYGGVLLVAGARERRRRARTAS
ncbi:signal peptidase I [Cellulomonas sp. HZM]|uniref:signal peptidase I n=1 Tax=Cellulomonas sp. HZM TaxID=1454010 RepID=UPI0009DD27F6|nr:signal peptidase I [Cellulomonas sp. HZM]